MNIEQFRYYTQWHYFINKNQHSAPADPWKLLRVAPTNIDRLNNEIRLNWGLGRIKGGSWDREENTTLLSDIAIYNGLIERFEKGYDWEETAQYQQAKATFEKGRTYRGYESLEEYRNIRCEYIDELFYAIKQNGYRPNAEATHRKATQRNPFEAAYAHHLEPLVVIGRSGDIYWCEGYHRLVIALILDIDVIPVYVLCRHQQWQRVRNRIHETLPSNISPEYDAHLAHPDLQDVLS